MASFSEKFTIGVEEEYQIIDPVTGELDTASEAILHKAEQTLGENVQPELQLSQIETATPVCVTLADVRREVAHMRREVIGAATGAGKRIAASGMPPFSHWRDQSVTPKSRYQGLAEVYQQLVREQAIFGCHVHVGLSDREVGLQVINRMRVWLAPLLALSANSPFWLGDDTGYASYRTEMWSRWPMAGPPLHFVSLGEHDAVVQSLIATGSIDEATKIYWDMRLSERFKTVEVRVADVCLTVDEAVMIAGLARALVRTCSEQARNNEPFKVVRPELIRMAHWWAARYGLEGELIDVVEERSVPAQVMIEMLLSFVRGALESEGDWNEISTIVHKTLQYGNGATRQREIYKRTGRLEEVVAFIVEETARGTS